MGKKKVELIFDILILSVDIEPGISSCLLKITSCLPSGKLSQSILARLLIATHSSTFPDSLDCQRAEVCGRLLDGRVVDANADKLA